MGGRLLNVDARLPDVPGWLLNVGRDLVEKGAGAVVLAAGVTALVAGMPSIGRALDIPATETFSALGAPDDPQVEVRWNRFYDMAGLNRILRELHGAYPELTELVDIGRSFQGREMLVLAVTDESTGPASSKPAMYIDGNIHGNEVQAGETVTYTAWYLCEMFAKVDRITELLRGKAFYLLPSSNPDGRDFWFHGEHTPHSSRTGQVPLDNDRDGRIDEDGPEDLDGDGHITIMRVADPWGDYKDDPDYPGYLMVRTDRDERGQYRRLGWEGFDNDGDGEVNEDGPGGYDANRNWPWAWQPEGVQYGAHHYPFSLPETRAIADFVLAHPNIAGNQNYHNAGGMILRPPGQESGRVQPEDEALARFIGDKGEELLPSYNSWIVWKDLYTVWGGQFEWFYGALGIISFTNELWSTDNMYRRELDDDRNEASRERAAFVRYLLQNQGLTEWKEYDHPDYGRIEIGGTSKNFGRVPPSFLLEEELHRNMAFTLYHAESMPRVRIGEVEVESAGAGLTRLRVPIENHGIIPTRIGQDVENSIHRPDIVTIEGARVVAAGRVTNEDLGLVEWQELRPERLEVTTMPGLDRTWVEFLVTGSGRTTIRVSSVKGGSVEQVVTLP